jgi:hypothetical protein
MKTIIGTEIYLSDDFSDLWLRALTRMPELWRKYNFIVFDNNPPNAMESEHVRLTCAMYDITYHRNAPSCRVGHSLDQLARYAHHYQHPYFIHVDIDCPILDKKHLTQLEKAMQDADVGAAIAANDDFAPYFSAFRTELVFDFSAGYYPVHEGMTDTPLRSAAKTGVFDHAQYWMHRAIESGYKVEQIDIPVLHAACASLLHSDSQRAILAGDEERQMLEQRHTEFWADDRVKQIMSK